jgi:hypothetical protein
MWRFSDLPLVSFLKLVSKDEFCFKGRWIFYFEDEVLSTLLLKFFKNVSNKQIIYVNFELSI